jgi:FKBP-type peptidyl-prolyl cis-trans isomerase
MSPSRPAELAHPVPSEAMRRIAALLVSVLLVAACGDSDGPETTAGESTPDQTTTAPAADTSSDAAASDYASTSTDGRPVVELSETPPPAPETSVYEDVVLGDGSAVEVGDLVEVHYLGLTLSEGTLFDASWDRNSSLFVPIGVGGLIPGWDQGLIGMTEGSRRLLVIPPEQAYGSRGTGVIGPDETLVFVIDLVQIVDGTPPEVPAAEQPGTELEIIDVTVGDGELVQAGDTITVHYQGNLLDGTVFDSSWPRAQPFTTVIGIGQVIQGWDEGMVGMREGGRRILVIPSELGYGSEGAGQTIPPNSPLVFVVDLLRIQG